MSFKEILSKNGIKPVLFTLFMASFGFGVIIPILPFYILSLGAKPFELGLLTATFAMASLVFSPIFGKLGDKIGRKKLLLIGTAGFVLSYLLFAVSNSLEMVFIARALEGLFAAAILPSTTSILSDLTTEKERAKAMGLNGMMFSGGFILGPAIGGIVSGISIHAVFIFSAILSAVNFAMIAFFLKEPKEKIESKNLVEKEAKLLHYISSPLLLLFLASMMINFMIGGLSAVLALYTGEKLGFSAPEVGIIFTYIGLMVMGMQLFGSKLIDKFGEIKIIQAGLLISGTGFFLLSFSTNWISLLLPLTVFVAGNAMVFPSVTSLISKKVIGKRGTVLGLESSFRSIGQIIGPLLAGFLYGINHTIAFIGLAISIWLYFAIFSIFASKKL